MEEGRVYDADDGVPVDGEGDGDAEHGKQVCEVDGAVEGVHDPCWRVIDEVVARGARGVGLFADEFMGGVFLGDGCVDEVLNI